MSIFLLLLLGCTSATLAEICYNNIGNQDAGSVVCDPNAESSACCGPGDLCLSNGLCQPGPEQPVKGLTQYYVDSCTDPSWNSPVCMAKCLNVTGNGVKACGFNQYCCFGYDGCDCSDSTQVISIAAGIVITTLPIATSTESISHSSTTSTASMRSSSESFQTVTTAPASISSDPTTAITSPPTVSSSPSSSSPAGLSTGAKAGIGIGVSLAGGLALASLAYVLIRRHRRTRPSYNFQDENKTGYGGKIYAHRNDEGQRLTEQNFRELFAPRVQNPAELDAY